MAFVKPFQQINRFLIIFLTIMIFHKVRLERLHRHAMKCHNILCIFIIIIIILLLLSSMLTDFGAYLSTKNKLLVL
jgi:hypothetical protein